MRKITIHLYLFITILLSTRTDASSADNLKEICHSLTTIETAHKSGPFAFENSTSLSTKSYKGPVPCIDNLVISTMNKVKVDQEQSEESIISDFQRHTQREAVLYRVLKDQDARTRRDPSSFPYTLHGHIIAYFKYTDDQGEIIEDIARGGSGTLVGPNHVLTAGHVIYSQSKKYPGRWAWPYCVEFTAGANGSDHQSAGRALGDRVLILEGWKTHHRSKYDLGMIILDRPLGITLGWLGLKSLPQNVDPQLVFDITGYPSDKPYQEQWGMKHKVEQYLSQQIIYDHDTAPGQSGSSIVVKGSSLNEYHIVGIHTGAGNDHNHGTRITDSTINIILKWLQNYQLPAFQKTTPYLAHLFPILHSQAQSNSKNSELFFKLGLCYEQGLGVKINLQEAFRYYTQAHKQGMGQALAKLGSIKERQREFQIALGHYQQAAKINDPHGQFLLAHFYELGKGGTEKKQELAHQLYKLAAEQGHIEAKTKLGIILKTKGQYEESLTEFNKASVRGSAWSKFHIAWLYQNKCIDIKSDPEKLIFMFYRESAELGCSYAQNNIAELYIKKQNYDEVLYWLQLSGQQENPRALNRLGWCYENGHGTNKNMNFAFDYYRRSASGGNKHGQYNVGRFYQKGYRPSHDINRPYEFFIKAAAPRGQEPGHAKALRELGRYYDKQWGNCGPKIDFNKALHYYQLAAQQNDAWAWYNIGELHRNYAQSQASSDNTIMIQIKQAYLKARDLALFNNYQNIVKQVGQKLNQTGWAYENQLRNDLALDFYQQAAECQDTYGIRNYKRLSNPKDNKRKRV